MSERVSKRVDIKKEEADSVFLLGRYLEFFKTSKHIASKSWSIVIPHTRAGFNMGDNKKRRLEYIKNNDKRIII